MRRYGRANMKELIVAFRNFAKAPKNNTWLRLQTYFLLLLTHVFGNDCDIKIV
jgi:hypothetical protein